MLQACLGLWSGQVDLLIAWDYFGQDINVASPLTASNQPQVVVGCMVEDDSRQYSFQAYEIDVKCILAKSLCCVVFGLALFASAASRHTRPRGHVVVK